jgi:phosphoserine/homoserine phosphotransferase
MVTRNIEGQDSVSAKRAGSKDCVVAAIDSPELPASELCTISSETDGGLYFPSAPLVAAFDLESVLVPEIWETVARTMGICRLALTTRDIADYGALMQERLRLCREHGLTLARLREIVGAMQPLPGAVEFLAWVQERMLVVIVSDTFHELAGPVVEKLGCPLMICNSLILDEEGYISGHRPHHIHGKAGAVAHFQQLGFQVVAVGDSYNDLTMLKAANAGILFRPCRGLADSVDGLPSVWSLQELQSELRKTLTGMPKSA